MTVCGLDASTTVVGWAFQTDGVVQDAGFIDISKKETNKEKGLLVIETIQNHPLFHQIDHINLEAALSGFAGGFTSQQVIIKLSRWNAVFEYMLGEAWGKPIVLLNVGTMRKKVLGKARIKGMKPKEYVKQELPKIVKHLSKFDRLNKKGTWDKRNEDVYDGVVCALYG
jgi:hypothetical protein